MDTETSGTMSTTHVEEFTRVFEVVDAPGELHAPVLMGSSPMPNLADDMEDPDDSTDAEAEVTQSARKRRRSRTSRSTPKSSKSHAKNRSRKSARAMEIEDALEDCCFNVNCINALTMSMLGSCENSRYFVGDSEDPHQN